jgi:hypothetical protein
MSSGGFSLAAPWSIYRETRERLQTPLQKMNLLQTYHFDRQLSRISNEFVSRLSSGRARCDGSIGIISGMNPITDPIDGARTEACSPDKQRGYRLCEEPFESDLPVMDSVSFPDNVRVKISQTQATNPIPAPHRLDLRATF